MKRFPVGLTVASFMALAVLVGLGVWQLQRLSWKTALLARIAALQGAPARPLGPVLAAAAAKPGSAEFTRVEADCFAPVSRGSMIFRYALRDGQIGWRLLTFCPLKSGPYAGILLDRGLVDRFAGLMAPRPARFAPPGSVTGVLRRPGAHSFLDAPTKQGLDGVTALQAVDMATVKAIAAQAGFGHPAPYLLAVESEAPAASGLTPAALPQDIPNNHFVYALTWFGLAGVLVWTYAAMLLKRFGER